MKREVLGCKDGIMTVKEYTIKKYYVDFEKGTLEEIYPDPDFPDEFEEE